MTMRNIAIMSSSEGGRSIASVVLIEKTATGERKYIELLRTEDGHFAVSWKKHLSSLSDEELVGISLRALSSIWKATGLAARIESASDELGPLYATKSHMRSWAREIFDACTPLLDDLRVDAFLRSDGGGARENRDPQNTLPSNRFDPEIRDGASVICLFTDRQVQLTAGKVYLVRWGCGPGPGHISVFADDGVTHRYNRRLFDLEVRS